MSIHASQRLHALTGYAFAEVDQKVAELRAREIIPIDFGVGDPTEPTPELIRRALKQACDIHASSGYPSYSGSRAYRAAIAAWNHRRFGVTLDADTEICATVGSKEGVFHLPEAFLNPGDIVIVPNPGYPPYARGTRFAEGEVHYVNLVAENHFLPDLERIPQEVRDRAKIMWINYPNNPTGATAPRDFFERAYAFCRQHDILLVSDEAYTENYYGADRPISLLQVGREGALVCQSLSKRSCMTGYRVGWMAGDARAIAIFKKLKTNIDSGTPQFIQDAAIAALSDESHVQSLRELYRRKRDIIVAAFQDVGLPAACPDATLYIWQRVPAGETSLSFAEKLLHPEIAIVTTPGNWISETVDGVNPGEGYVRLALVPSITECERAAERIVKFLAS